jgi:tetrahydromethanopterin S-methyltransferase subunit G
MSELAIKTHDFNEAKNQLKKFSERIPETVSLEPIATSAGPFGWFDHDVTGDELNKLTAQIQKHLISSRDLHTKSIKEFGQVYKALEALDKNYIQAIITAIKAAEESSNQAKKSALEAEKNSIDIKKTIEVQKQTIDVLKQFKEQINKYKHLKNIDEVWSDCQLLKNDIKSINCRIDNLEEKIDKALKESKNDINNLLIFKKLKISYVLAGSSITIALISIILNVLGII